MLVLNAQVTAHTEYKNIRNKKESIDCFEQSPNSPSTAKKYPKLRFSFV